MYNHTSSLYLFWNLIYQKRKVQVFENDYLQGREGVFPMSCD